MKTTTPSPEEMKEGLTRFADLKSGDQYFREKLPASVAEAILPIAMPQQLYMVLSPEASAEDAYSPCGRAPDGMVAMLAECRPGVGAPLHAHHLTYEIFFVAKGRFRIFWGDEAEHSLELDQFDTICVPPGCNRGFENISEDQGFLLAIAGGHDLVLKDSAGSPVTRDRILDNAPEVIEGVKTTEWLERMGLRYNAGLDDQAL